MIDEASTLELLRPTLIRSARRYLSAAIPLGLELEDLEQIAMLAAVKAIRSFDPSKGTLQAFAKLAAERDIRHALDSARKKWGRNEEFEETAADDPHFALLFEEKRRRKEPVAPTPRIIEVLKLIEQGLSYTDIAEALKLSRWTIYNYSDWLKRYFGSRTPVGIVNAAKRQGFL